MHTRDGRAGRDVMRSARSGRAGKGAWRALCPAYVCKRDEGGCAECAEAGVRGAGKGRYVRPRARPVPGGARGRSGATHPGSAEGPPLSSRSGSWFPAPDSRLPVPSSRPASCSAHAPAPSPDVAGNATPAVVARRPPRRSAARAGGSAGPGRQTGAAPQSGHAPRSPPRAPSRLPAPLPLPL